MTSFSPAPALRPASRSPQPSPSPGAFYASRSPACQTATHTHIHRLAGLAPMLAPHPSWWRRVHRSALYAVLYRLHGEQGALSWLCPALVGARHASCMSRHAKIRAGAGRAASLLPASSESGAIGPAWAQPVQQGWPEKQGGSDLLQGRRYAFVARPGAAEHGALRRRPSRPVTLGRAQAVPRPGGDPRDRTPAAQPAAAPSRPSPLWRSITDQDIIPRGSHKEQRVARREPAGLVSATQCSRIQKKQRNCHMKTLCSYVFV